MLNKKVILPLALFTTAVFAIGYGITTNYQPLVKMFTSTLLPDSGDAMPQFGKDVSQMFNERGYYKSNGFSFDENEIINDFNGNLMYEIPLYNYKLAGDLQEEIKLVYNGSVGHQLNVGTMATYENERASYNMNFPEWILSLNGIGVQVFNFETKFFTEPVNNQDEISGNYLNALIPGYHYDDRLISVETSDRDRINILAGDGSVITLVNKSWQNGDADSLRYMGIYHSEDKESYMKARVRFDLSDVEVINHGYRNRIVELMKGDGLVYEFKEYKVPFLDFAVNAPVTGRKRPQMLLLNRIMDKYGNSINLGYEFVIAPNTISGTLYGRPLLVNISANIGGNMNVYTDIGIMYSGNAVKLFNNSDVNGNYTFRLYQTVNYSTGESLNNRGSVSRIINPLFQEAVILYQPENQYIRKLTQVPNPVYSEPLALNFNNLYRIKNFTNFLGAKKGYEYYPTGTNSIEIYYNSNYLRSSSYQGYGRDPFYSNMLYQKYDTTESNTAKANTRFEYYYLDVNENTNDYPVDENDSNRTTKHVYSLDNNTKNDSPDEMLTVRRYKIYPVRYETPAYPEVLNYNGITKLINEDIKEASSGLVKQHNEYTYSLGTRPGGGYIGSMLMESKKNYIGSVLREWGYEYTHLGGGADSVVLFKKETDPLNNYSAAYMDTDYVELNFMLLNGSRILYRYGIPLKEQRFSSSDVKLSEKRYSYIKDSVNSLGYYGQLISEKVYNAGGFTDYIETNYEYYRQDTTGRYLYTTGLPFIEGNLKLIKRPDGQEEKYFYHPISKSENNSTGDTPETPKVSYKVKYNDGSVTILAADFSDNRLPTRIDNYKFNGSGRDTLKRVYFEYNAAGNPVKIINENKFLTEIKYQAVHRVSSITLPGDFSKTASYDSLYFNRDTVFTSVIVPSVGWGQMNGASQKDSLQVTIESPAVGQCQYFKMSYDNIYGTSYYPFIKFNYNNLGNFAVIDSAMFYIAPISYALTLNGSTVSQSNFSVSINAAYDKTGTFYSKCASNGNNVEEGKALKHSYSVSSDINAALSGCNFAPHYLDIKALLQNLAANGRDLYGIYLTPQTSLSIGEGDHLYYYMNFTNCNNFWPPTWTQNYAPKISIYGKYVDVDTLKVPVIQGGTYVYRYDDDQKTITTYSRLNNTPNKLKKIKYYIDGFGNTKQKNIYVNNNDSNIYLNAFNYLQMPANNTDARNNSTKLSYDYMGRQTKTLNADNTYSTTAFAYDNTLAGYFGGTYSGFVEKQTFTDETNRSFNKYFDAVGNLLREEKFTAATGGGDPVYEDNPYDPDTTFTGQDFPLNTAALTTDYKYDNLYRLTEVKTPGGKTISYYYDAYGRQSQRSTPDAGVTRYSYDKNGNLILSQDANQYNISDVLNTRRAYDGLNRLVSISDVKITGTGGNGPMGDTLLPFEFDSPPNTDSVYIFNVYDTITSETPSMFNSNKPSDYNSLANYTRGNLVATAYRTVLGEPWGYKFYRYDERGNVVKLWHYIVGLGWKTEMYYHNSQSQLTRNWYQSGGSDSKLFTYGYDDAGRLDYVNQYVGATPEDPESEGDSPGSYFTLTKYTYNENSQVATHKLNNNSVTTTYVYNERNWVNWINQSPGPIFRYVLFYNANGNIRFQDVQGSYSNNFAVNNNRKYQYIYDNSNRLLKANDILVADSNSYDIINGYDKDGNFTGMKRYGSSNNLADNYSYQYFSGTNRLKKVSAGLADDYAYDNNGNMISDAVNRTGSIKYDHRNLMTEIRAIKTEAGGGIGGGTVDVTYLTQYRYDEAGNRVRKTRWKYTGSNPDPVFEGDSPSWSLQSDEFYVRDISGKEIALYSGSSLTQWNIWGLDNVGKINADTTRNYYLKDHLGSVRVVLNGTNTVISAQDYDAWGYPLENRTYNASTMKYDFTGKERDNETSYDYFGARYYDSRIGRWGQIEPLLDKYVSWSPYVYSILNPISTKDNTGMAPNDVIVGGADRKGIEAKINDDTNLKVKIDENTGKLTVIGGKAETEMEKMLLTASKDANVTVDLQTVNDNSPGTWSVDLFEGSELTQDGKVRATQKFNLSQAESFEQAYSSDVGLSIMHAINEAYIGGSLFPGEKPSKNNSNYGWSHFLTVLLEAKDYEIDYYKLIDIRYSPHQNTYYYYNKESEENPLVPIK